MIHPTIRRTVGFVCAILAVVIACLWGFWCWLLRDGLAPGFVPSTGVTAVVRFLDGFWLPGLISIVLLLVSYKAFQVARMARE